MQGADPANPAPTALNRRALARVQGRMRLRDELEGFDAARELYEALHIRFDIEEIGIPLRLTPAPELDRPGYEPGEAFNLPISSSLSVRDVAWKVKLIAMLFFPESIPSPR